MNKTSLLAVKNLHISFRNEGRWLPAVQEASFTLEYGQTLGIVGESGSGKSVTSLAIMQLLAKNQSCVEAAAIKLEGRSLLHCSGEN